MTDLRALLKRLEELEGPDREVDGTINELTQHTASPVPRGMVPFYTGSIDAAADLFALLFYGVPAWWEIEDNSAILDNGADQEFEASGPSEEIALLKTIVQALIAKAEAEEGVGEF